MLEWGNIVIEDTLEGEVYKCKKCGNILGSATRDWKEYALKKVAPLSKGQPAYLEAETDRFFLREFYCPNCGVMFEVQMLDNSEPDVVTFKLKSE